MCLLNVKIEEEGIRYVYKVSTLGNSEDSYISIKRKKEE